MKVHFYLQDEESPVELIEGSASDPAAESYDAYKCDRLCLCGKKYSEHEWRAGWLCCSPDTDKRQFTAAV